MIAALILMVPANAQEVPSACAQKLLHTLDLFDKAEVAESRGQISKCVRLKDATFNPDKLHQRVMDTSAAFEASYGSFLGVKDRAAAVLSNAAKLGSSICAAPVTEQLEVSAVGATLQASMVKLEITQTALFALDSGFREQYVGRFSSFAQFFERKAHCVDTKKNLVAVSEALDKATQACSEQIYDADRSRTSVARLTQALGKKCAKFEGSHCDRVLVGHEVLGENKYDVEVFLEDEDRWMAVERDLVGEAAADKALDRCQMDNDKE
jgi:hypothetical protein